MPTLISTNSFTRQIKMVTSLVSLTHQHLHNDLRLLPHVRARLVMVLVVLRVVMVLLVGLVVVTAVDIGLVLVGSIAIVVTDVGVVVVMVVAGACGGRRGGGVFDRGCVVLMRVVFILELVAVVATVAFPLVQLLLILLVMEAVILAC